MPNLVIREFRCLRSAWADSRAGGFAYGALEQLARNLDALIDFFIAAKAALVVQIELAIETYSQDSIVDYLGHWFQSKWGYSSGLVGLLRARQAKGEIPVGEIKRLGFGSIMMGG